MADKQINAISCETERTCGVRGSIPCVAAKRLTAADVNLGLARQEASVSSLLLAAVQGRLRRGRRGRETLGFYNGKNHDKTPA